MSGADGDYYAGQDKIEPEAVETERTRTGPDYGGGASWDASVTWQEAVPGILVSMRSADAGSTSKQPERALEGVSGTSSGPRLVRRLWTELALQLHQVLTELLDVSSAADYSTLERLDLSSAIDHSIVNTTYSSTDVFLIGYVIVRDGMIS
uniref:Uncharacterized protein n=1 Tax=Sphaerodactylus townsendi TaxID=933632 RepID=A0ACB8FQ10_9SAUR